MTDGRKYSFARPSGNPREPPAQVEGINENACKPLCVASSFPLQLSCIHTHPKGKLGEKKRFLSR